MGCRVNDHHLTELISRQRAQITRGAAFCVLLTTGLALTAGPVTAIAAVSATLVITFGLPTAISHRNRLIEARRRRDGLDPSWPAQLPLRYLNPSGAPSHAARGTEDRVVPGRLTLTADDGLTWTPTTTAARNFAATTMSWNSSWTARVDPVLAWLGQGLLTLRNPIGDELHIRVRNSPDLTDTLAMRHTSIPDS